MESVKVRVPATTANCGPGFDAMGIALSLYNEMQLTLLPENGLEIILEGTGADVLPTDGQNIVVKTINMFFDHFEKNFHSSPRRCLPGMRIKMNNQIPLSRGLGSSAAAIVAALAAANELTGAKFSKKDILKMATDIEGHPDNVAPAIFGGVTLSIVAEGDVERINAAKPEVQCLKFLPKTQFSLIAAIPEFELSTTLAREALPKSVPFSDAVFNISRAALLTGALCQGELQYLKYALEDKIHQPYRATLITGMADVLSAATANGALGAAISGSGPCLIAFAATNEDMIGEAMVKAFDSHNVKAVYLKLTIDKEGVKTV